MIDMKRAKEIRDVLKENGWRQCDDMLADDFLLVGGLPGADGVKVCAIDIAGKLETATTYDNIIDFIEGGSNRQGGNVMSEGNKILIAVIATAIPVVLLIMNVGCAALPSNSPPLYGPHNTTTMTNRKWDIERRNIYSDGWQDAMAEAAKR